MGTNDHLAAIPLDRVVPNPKQPRKEFDQTALAELAESIAQHGVIQPIEVVASGDLYVIRHGERRVRASRLAGLTEIPAVVSQTEYEDRELLIRALIENLQRQDMRPSEEGQAFQELLDQGMTLIDLGSSLGVSMAYISSRTAWLSFDPEIRAMVDRGDMPRDLRVSRALATVPEAHRLPLAQRLAGSGRLSIKGVMAAVETYHALTKPSEDKAASRRSLSVNGSANGSANAHLPANDCPKRPRNSEVRAHSLTIVYGDCDPDGPEAEMLETAARETCGLCPLFAHGLTSACHECGMTVLLRIMRRKRGEAARRDAARQSATGRDEARRGAMARGNGA